MRNTPFIASLALFITGCSGSTDTNPLAVVANDLAPPAIQQPAPVPAPQPTPEPSMTETTTAPPAEPDPEPQAIAAPVEQAPALFDPITGTRIALIRPTWTREQIADQQLLCDRMQYSQNLNIMTTGLNATTRWHHFPDGTGERFAYGEPVPFKWSLSDDGIYSGDSPLAGTWAEKVEFANGEVQYRYWNPENAQAELFACKWL